MFFIQKTSRLAEDFNFVRIDLKHSVKVGTIFLRLRRYCFSFWWDFWRRRKCPRRLLHEGGLSGTKQSPQKCLTGFWYLTGLLLETKKLLTTDISNSLFISSSRWEAVIFPLARSRPIRSNQNKQCAVHHGKCQWVFNGKATLVRRLTRPSRLHLARRTQQGSARCDSKGWWEGLSHYPSLLALLCCARRATWRRLGTTEFWRHARWLSLPVLLPDVQPPPTVFTYD